MKRLAVLGLAITGLTLFALVQLWPWQQAEGSAQVVPPLVAILAVTALVYLAAVGLVLRHTLPSRAIWIVLIVAVAIRLPVLFTPPILSTDIYRYIWDGRVQIAGINPYLFLPSDPALADLRDATIYPRITRADYAHTIYPPMAQLVFATIARVAQSVFAEKACMLGFEAVAIFCALRLLKLARLPPERVLIYAWNPVPVWAFACDGHLDAIGIGLLAVALLLRCLKRDGIAGVVFGAAVLVKFLPAVVAPALWRRGAGWRLAVAATATILALYACYAGAGRQILGFLPGYGVEEGIDSGNGIWLLAGLQHLVALPSEAVPIYAGVALLALAGVGCWFMTRPRPRPGTPEDVVMICNQAAILAAGVTFIISPHYAWYFAWLALPVVVRPYWSVIWLATAPVVLYHDPFNDPFYWRSVVYVPAALLALSDIRGTLSRQPGMIPYLPKGIP
jgi:alpha-1,6-mannosyltransferase